MNNINSIYYIRRKKFPTFSKTKVLGTWTQVFSKYLVLGLKYFCKNGKILELGLKYFSKYLDLDSSIFQITWTWTQVFFKILDPSLMETIAFHFG